jgi:tripeptide aminopeptidase
MIDEGRLLEKFLEYVRIDSETLNEREMSERVEADLRSMGLEVWTDDAGCAIGSNGRNVYARLAGELPREPFLFSAHVDTVRPGNGVRPAVTGGVISSGGDTILAAYDKSGVASIVEALRVVTEKGLAHRTLEVLFSIAEEGGLNGAKNADFGSLRSKMAFVFDSDGDVGTVITSAPGQTKFNATVTGRSAHAGIAPEKGISAIQAAAEGVAAMKLLRIDEETTANIGTFKSEYATNIVPEHAVILGEARSRDKKKLDAQIAHMTRCLEESCGRHGAILTCETETAYASYSFDDGEPIILTADDAIGRIGIKPTHRAGGGGSDANVMNQRGICAIVLATGMDQVHTTSERITLKNLNDTARLCLSLMTS